MAMLQEDGASPHRTRTAGLIAIAPHRPDAHSGSGRLFDARLPFSQKNNEAWPHLVDLSTVCHGAVITLSWKPDRVGARPFIAACAHTRPAGGPGPCTVRRRRPPPGPARPSRPVRYGGAWRRRPRWAG